MEGLLAILGKVGFDWQVALANFVNFLIIFFILKKFAFKPIGKIIEERNQKIEKGLKDATEYEKLLQEAKASYEEALQKAKTEADSILKQSKKDATAQKVRMLEDAKDEVLAMVEAGKKSLELEKNKMLAEAKKEMVILVTKSTEKVISSNVDKSFSERIIKALS